MKQKILNQSVESVKLERRNRFDNYAGENVTPKYVNIAIGLSKTNFTFLIFDHLRNPSIIKCKVSTDVSKHLTYDVNTKTFKPWTHMSSIFLNLI